MRLLGTPCVIRVSPEWIGACFAPSIMQRFCAGCQLRLGSLLVRRRDGLHSLKDLSTRIPVIVSWELTSRPPAMTSNLFLFPNVRVTIFSKQAKRGVEKYVSIHLLAAFLICSSMDTCRGSSNMCPTARPDMVTFQSSESLRLAMTLSLSSRWPEYTGGNV